MCDVTVMTTRINKLSRSGFDNRLKLTSHDEMANVHAFSQKIEKMVDETYDVFNEIGEEEWNIIKEPLDILISTTKDLLRAYKKRYKNVSDGEELEGALSYLMEVRNDIYNYRILAPKDEELQNQMKRIDTLLSESV